MFSFAYSTVKLNTKVKYSKTVFQPSATTCTTLIFFSLRLIRFQFFTHSSYSSLHLPISLSESKVLEIKIWSWELQIRKKAIGILLCKSTTISDMQQCRCSWHHIYPQTDKQKFVFTVSRRKSAIS